MASIQILIVEGEELLERSEASKAHKQQRRRREFAHTKALRLGRFDIDKPKWQKGEEDKLKEREKALPKAKAMIGTSTKTYKGHTMVPAHFWVKK